MYIKYIVNYWSVCHCHYHDIHSKKKNLLWTGFSRTRGVLSQGGFVAGGFCLYLAQNTNLLIVLVQLRHQNFETNTSELLSLLWYSRRRVILRIYISIASTVGLYVWPVSRQRKVQWLRRDTRQARWGNTKAPARKYSPFSDPCLLPLSLLAQSVFEHITKQHFFAIISTFWVAVVDIKSSSGAAAS